MSNRPTVRRALIAACGAAGMALLVCGGCQSFLRNTETEIGLDTARPFAPQTIVGATPPARAGEPQDLKHAPETSLSGLDRGGWDPQVVGVPDSQPSHGAIYTRDVRLNTGRARDKGTFPTAMSAIELTSLQGNQDQALEGAMVPFVTGFDVILILPRMFVTQPWETTRTALDPYQRAPRVDTAGTSGAAHGGAVRPAEAP